MTWATALIALAGLAVSGAARAEDLQATPDLSKLQLHELQLNEAQLEAEYPGGTAVLTLDPKLQSSAQRLLARAHAKRGAIVVASAKTGEILAWVESHAGRITAADLPAASLFKIITAATLLERTPVTPTTRVCIEGGHHGIWQRHLEAADGPNALCDIFYRALGRSRNAVFAQLAHRHLEPDELLEVAERFGFNRPVPFDFEVPFGSLQVPDAPLQFARTAAGFENSWLSPLGALHLIQTIAGIGRPTPLYLVESAGSYRRPPQAPALPRVLNPVIARRVRNMLEQTVHAGTSLKAFSRPNGASYLGSLRAAGKTGTLKADGARYTTSWFVGFAPSRGTEVSVAVVIEYGRIWHQKANEVARDVLRSYLAQQGVPGVSDPLE